MLKNLNNIWNEITTFGQKASDFIAKVIGSWIFIITQSTVLFIWILINVLTLINHFDPYPFILLNLFLSFQAALIMPIILMSQNRQEEKDRIKADYNYDVNLKTEKDVELIIKYLETHKEILMEILNKNK